MSKYVVTVTTREIDTDTREMRFVSDTYISKASTIEDIYRAVVGKYWDTDKLVSVYVRPTDEHLSTMFVVKRLYWDVYIERYFIESVSLRGATSYDEVQRDVENVARTGKKIYLIRPATEQECEQYDFMSW